MCVPPFGGLVVSVLTLGTYRRDQRPSPSSIERELTGVRLTQDDADDDQDNVYHNGDDDNDDKSGIDNDEDIDDHDQLLIWANFCGSSVVLL